MVDADLYFSVKGKCCFCTDGDNKEVGVGGLDSLVKYHLYCYPSFKNPSPWHRNPPVPCTPPLVPCARVPVPTTLDTLSALFFFAPLALDPKHNPANPDALAPVFALGLVLTAPESHIPVHITLGVNTRPPWPGYPRPHHTWSLPLCTHQPWPCCLSYSTRPSWPYPTGTQPPVPWGYSSRGGSQWLPGGGRHRMIPCDHPTRYRKWPHSSTLSLESTSFL